MPSSAPSPSSTKQPTQARRASLIAAALALAAKQSPASVTTAQLAAAIGVTQGAVFRHFESKEAIWLAVLETSSARLLKQLQAAANAHDDALHALRAVFDAHVAFIISHPGMPRLMLQELQHPQETALKRHVSQLMTTYRQLLKDLLGKAMARGQLRPDTDLQAASVLFVGSIQGLVIQSLLAGHLDAMGQQAPAVFALFLSSISAQGTAPSSPAAKPRHTRSSAQP